jgi:hypothetical protein
VGKKNENLHIPQLKKGIYVLKIVVQSILEKIGCEGNGPQKNTQNSNAPNRGYKNLMEAKTLKATQRKPNSTLVGLNHKAYQI